MSEIPEPKYVQYTGMFGCGINYPKEDCYWYAEEQDMNARIPYCKCKSKFPIGPEDCKHCELYHSKNKKTNADRIRSMTDEELANKMSGLESFALTCGGGWPPEKWLDWLRNEAKEGK